MRKHMDMYAQVQTYNISDEHAILVNVYGTHTQSYAYASTQKFLHKSEDGAEAPFIYMPENEHTNSCIHTHMYICRSFSGKAEKGKENPYSCVVLAGWRTVEERRANLQHFKDGDVRFLICTGSA